MNLSEKEAKAALSLRPYFSRDPIVFDVGSNKGEWSDIFVKNCQMHLFECNDMLLTYTKVKYDYLRNVNYCGKAVYKESGKKLPFFYFTNENNGLSSIYHYDKWDYLPMKRGQVETITIDDYCEERGITYIDFLKIDVEGAEFDVIEGAKNMLYHTKFVQVEYNDNYKTNGHTFAEMIEIMKVYGFLPYNENLERIEAFVEDFKLANFIFIKGGFTQDWNSEFRNNTAGLKVNFALEVGCFEGLTSCYICDELLTPHGRLICVDPLTDEYLPGHKDNGIFVGQYERFIRNTAGRPIELIRKKSSEVWDHPGFSDYRFDLIYIDGDHTYNAVKHDALKALGVLKVGGIMIFDDYQGYEEQTTEALRWFMKQEYIHIKVLSEGYQLVIKKIRE